jgi:hypothetical protein
MRFTLRLWLPSGFLPRTSTCAFRCMRLYGEIVDRLEPLGIPRDHVSITLRESPAENWGVRSGQAACDVDLGFNVKV